MTWPLGSTLVYMGVWARTRTWTCVLAHTHAPKHTPPPFSLTTNADQQRTMGETFEFVNEVLLEQGHIFISPFLYSTPLSLAPLSPPNFLCSFKKQNPPQKTKNQNSGVNLLLPVCTRRLEHGWAFRDHTPEEHQLSFPQQPPTINNFSARGGASGAPPLSTVRFSAGLSLCRPCGSYQSSLPVPLLYLISLFWKGGPANSTIKKMCQAGINNRGRERPLLCSTAD